MPDYGYIRAQEQYDRKEPPLPVCEGCGHTADALGEVNGRLLCENCLTDWVESHAEDVAGKILANGYF